VLLGGWPLGNSPATLTITFLHAGLLVAHSNYVNVEVFKEILKTFCLVDIDLFTRMSFEIMLVRNWILLLKINEIVGLILLLLVGMGNHENSFVLIVLESDDFHGGSAEAPPGGYAFLLHIFNFLCQ
jgi:hypothetical protein